MRKWLRATVIAVMALVLSTIASVGLIGGQRVVLWAQSVSQIIAELLAWGAVPHVSTNAALIGKTTTAYPAGVWRDDYASGNGAPPLFYAPSSSACPLNGGAGDNGSQVQSADGKCWIAKFSGPQNNVLDWGAVADSTTGHAAANANAFNAALSYLGNAPAAVYVPYNVLGYNIGANFLTTQSGQRLSCDPETTIYGTASKVIYEKGGGGSPWGGVSNCLISDGTSGATAIRRATALQAVSYIDNENVTCVSMSECIGDESIAVTISTTGSSTTVGVSSVTGLSVGMALSGAGLQYNNAILSVGSTTVTVQLPATATATGVAATAQFPVLFGLQIVENNGGTTIPAVACNGNNMILTGNAIQSYTLGAGIGVQSEASCNNLNVTGGSIEQFLTGVGNNGAPNFQIQVNGVLFELNTTDIDPTLTAFSRFTGIGNSDSSTGPIASVGYFPSYCAVAGCTMTGQFTATAVGQAAPSSQGTTQSSWQLNAANGTLGYALGRSQANNNAQDFFIYDGVNAIDISNYTSAAGWGFKGPMTVSGVGQSTSASQGTTQSNFQLNRANGTVGYDVGRSAANNDAQDFFIYDGVNALDIATYSAAAGWSFPAPVTSVGSVAGGSSPTLTTGSCSGSAAAGGRLAGKFTAALCSAGTYVISGLPAAPNGYTCGAWDQTTPADALVQTGNSATSVTLKATTVASDVIAFSCQGW